MRWMNLRRRSHSSGSGFFELAAGAAEGAVFAGAEVAAAGVAGPVAVVGGELGLHGFMSLGREEVAGEGLALLQRVGGLRARIYLRLLRRRVPGFDLAAEAAARFGNAPQEFVKQAFDAGEALVDVVVLVIHFHALVESWH